MPNVGESECVLAMCSPCSPSLRMGEHGVVPKETLSACPSSGCVSSWSVPSLGVEGAVPKVGASSDRYDPAGVGGAVPKVG